MPTLDVLTSTDLADSALLCAIDALSSEFDRRLRLGKHRWCIFLPASDRVSIGDTVIIDDARFLVSGVGTDDHPNEFVLSVSDYVGQSPGTYWSPVSQSSLIGKLVQSVRVVFQGWTTSPA